MTANQLQTLSYTKPLVRSCGTKEPEVGSTGKEWSGGKASNNVLPLQLT